MKNVNAMEGARYRDSIIEIPSVEDIERKPKHTQRCSPKKLPVPTLTLVKWMVKSVVTFREHRETTSQLGHFVFSEEGVITAVRLGSEFELSSALARSP